MGIEEKVSERYAGGAKKLKPVCAVRWIMM
jgi:hypothetical protein